MTKLAKRTEEEATEICLIMKPVRTLKLPLMISKCIPSAPETLVYYYSYFTDKDTGALSQVPRLILLPRADGKLPKETEIRMIKQYA